MKNLHITVDNKIATYLQRDGEIVCGNSDYQITFTFDADWDAYETKTARFIWNGKHMDIPFSGSVCQVPTIKNTDEVKVGVYAGDISTTTPAIIPCKRSVLCGDEEMYEGNPEVCRDQAIDAAERAEAAAAESGKAVAKALAKMTAQEAGESETLVMSQKAVTELVADALGNDAPTYETVDSVDQMTDTTKQYVLASTGTVWAYTTKEVYVEHNAYDATTATFNARVNGSGAVVSDTTAKGTVTTDFVEQAYDFENCKVTIAGVEKLADIWGGTGYVYFTVGYYDKDQKPIGSVGCSEMWGGWAAPSNWDGYPSHRLKDNPNTPFAVRIFDVSKNAMIDPVKNTAFVRVGVTIKYNESISTVDCEGLTINFSTKNGNQMVSSWEDTGLTPSTSGGNYVTLLTKVNENAAQIHELDKRVTAIESESGTVTIPSYWEDAVAEKIQTVQALQEEGGADCFSFVWASDTHCTPNQAASGQYSTAKNVGKIANRLMNDLSIPFFAVTGDLSADVGSADTFPDKTDIDEFFDVIVYPVGKERVLLTLGNHDGTTYSTGSDTFISKATRFNWFMRPFCDDNKRIWGGGEYYYVDYPQGKIRFIALCSSNGTTNIYRDNKYDGNQLKWLAEEALNAPKGYTVVVLSHFPSNGTEEGGSPANSDVLMAILTAFDTKNNYSGSADGVSISATYSNSDAILCGFFAGHIHNDTIDTSKGFPIITVDAAGNKTEVADRTFKNGSTTETVFDVVSINKATRTIYCTRLGAGDDREISY